MNTSGLGGLGVLAAMGGKALPRATAARGRRCKSRLGANLPKVGWKDLRRARNKRARQARQRARALARERGA